MNFLHCVSNSPIFLSQLQRRCFHSSKNNISALTAKLIPKKNVRHFLSLEDYSPNEIFALVEKAGSIKKIMKKQELSKKDLELKQRLEVSSNLNGKTVALVFTKRSTRTRIATETSVSYLGGRPMFLGPGDIQLGVNETLLDSSLVISSMVDGIVARVNDHEEIKQIAKYSQVPVINALSDSSHPIEILADMLTLYEIFGKPFQAVEEAVKGLKFTWVGDSNNILYEYLTAFPKCGINLTVSTPKDYPVPEKYLNLATSPEFAQVHVTNSPTEAIANANVIATDTWISMGQEKEKKQRLIDFAGYQINDQMIAQGKPHRDFVFMHCLPRKPNEVSDEVFYGTRSSVFKGAENRKYATLSAIHSLLVENGKF